MHMFAMFLYILFGLYLYRERGYTNQRKHASWVGGSLIGSFETYHKNLKTTRQEWDENPDTVLYIKTI